MQSLEGVIVEQAEGGRSCVGRAGFRPRLVAEGQLEFGGELRFESESGSFLRDGRRLLAGGGVGRVLALDAGAVVVVLLQLLLALAVLVVATTLHLADQLVHLQLGEAVLQHLRRPAVPVLVLLVEGEELKILPFLLSPIESQLLLLGHQLPRALNIHSLLILRRVPALPVDPGETKRRVELARNGSDMVPSPRLRLHGLQLLLDQHVVQYGLFV